MTIAICVACPDALVLAADSRATAIGEGSSRVASDHERKVFDLGDRFAAAHFGWVFLEGNTIAGVMEESRAQTRLPDNLDGIAERLRDYFGDRFKKHVAAGHDEPPPE